MSQRYLIAAVLKNGWAREPSSRRARSRPAELSITGALVARPTDRLDALRDFYGEGLGLPEIGSFADEDGYSGVIFGMPDESLMLEFTDVSADKPPPAPAADSLLALYFEDALAVDALAEQLAARGYHAVEPENPYWETVEDSVTVADPDGWRVVLVKPRRRS